MFILTEKRLYIGRIYLCLSLRREPDQGTDGGGVQHRQRNLRVLKRVLSFVKVNQGGQQVSKDGQGVCAGASQISFIAAGILTFCLRNSA